MHVQLYAYRYPAEIAGLVLVDGQNEDDSSSWTSSRTARSPKRGRAAWPMTATAPRAPRPGRCPIRVAGRTTAERAKSLAAAIEQERGSPAYWRANESEFASCCGFASSQQLHEARRDIGDFPVTILARSISPYAVPDQPPSPRNRAGEDVHKASLEAVLAYAPKGELRVVPNASHLIQIEQPEAVSDTIIELLGEDQGGGQRAARLMSRRRSMRGQKR